MNFEQADISALLDAAGEALLETASFGIVRMDKAGRVDFYNKFESQLSGLSSQRVLGKHFFTDVAPCTNNYLVAQRFEDGAPLDAFVPYVFTLRMKPTPVTLRLVNAPESSQMYLLVQRR